MALHMARVGGGGNIHKIRSKEKIKSLVVFVVSAMMNESYKSKRSPIPSVTSSPKLKSPS